MAKASKKVLALCAKYNNSLNVLFMMKADDDRIVEGSRFNDGNYTILDPDPVYDHKAKTLTTNQGVYTVFSDWSLRLVA